MVQWKRLFTETSHYYGSEIEHLLPTHNSDPIPSAIPPAEVTKVALRLKYQIERVIPYELDEWKITRANSAVITRKVEQTAKEAGGEQYGACVVFGLLVCKRWFGRQSVLELWDAGLHGCRAVACEVLAKRIIENEENQDFLLHQTLLQRYSILNFNSQEPTPAANVIERAVDQHALLVVGSSGYQRCISHLWRGWLVQSEADPSTFTDYKAKASTDYWTHVDPNRMRAPCYQNAVQVFFSVLFLALYTGAINTINATGDLDLVEGILYIMTFGFICDEVNKLRKVGRFYIGFWNVFNSTLYALLTVSFVTRMIALGKPVDDAHGESERSRFNELSYNFLAFSAPMFWMRLLFYLDTFRFFGAMLVVLKVMMKESLIFFALLLVVMVGFLQAFIGMDQADDDNREVTGFIMQAMVNTVMQSPDFTGFGKFAPPFGIILYYIFTFVVMVVLLNILIALYNSAYQDITDNAIDEYMALFSQRTMQFIRAPDENVFIAPFNLIEIFFLILPFEWWMPAARYERLNNAVMVTIYSPLLFITAWLESKEARRIRQNQLCGRLDEDTTEEWEQMPDGFDPGCGGWKEKVEVTKPNLETDAAIVEVRELKTQVEELTELVQGLKEPAGPS